MAKINGAAFSCLVYGFEITVTLFFDWMKFKARKHCLPYYNYKEK